MYVGGLFSDDSDRPPDIQEIKRILIRDHSELVERFVLAQKELIRINAMTNRWVTAQGLAKAIGEKPAFSHQEVIDIASVGLQYPATEEEYWEELCDMSDDALKVFQDYRTELDLKYMEAFDSLPDEFLKNGWIVGI